MSDAAAIMEPARGRTALWWFLLASAGLHLWLFQDGYPPPLHLAPASAAQPTLYAVLAPKPGPVSATQPVPKPTAQPKPQAARASTPRPSPAPQPKTRVSERPLPKTITRPKPAPIHRDPPPPMPTQAPPQPTQVSGVIPKPTSASAPQTADNAAGANTRATSPPDYAGVLQELDSHLRAHFSYPAIARKRGWQGTVLLAFFLDGNGTISQIHVAHSSGYRLLDHSAMQALGAVGRLATIPTWLRRQGTTLELPVIYRLTEG